jgi:hypothetical protein
LRFAALAATSLAADSVEAKRTPVRLEDAPKTKEENGGPAPQIREPMRAEVERLVEEIKQSVGLLRRHL